MVNIPMTAKGAMQTSGLSQINRAGRKQTLQTLLQPVAKGAGGGPAPTPPPNRGPAPRRQPDPAPRPDPVPTPPPPRRPHPPATGTVLQKGQKIQLDPGIDLIEVGMGWELSPGGQGYDLDVEAFLLGPSGMVPGDGWFVFYNQPASPDGAVRLMSPGGSGPADDAALQLRLSQVNPGVERIAFILTINEAKARGSSFGNVSSAYVRLVNQTARQEMVRFQLTDYYHNVCSMVVGELYRYKGQWRFNAVGNGTGDDLAGLCVRYGVNIR